MQSLKDPSSTMSMKKAMIRFMMHKKNVSYNYRPSVTASKTLHYKNISGRHHILKNQTQFALDQI